jgi:hypothetical protein
VTANRDGGGGAALDMVFFSREGKLFSAWGEKRE